MPSRRWSSSIDGEVSSASRPIALAPREARRSAASHRTEAARSELQVQLGVPRLLAGRPGLAVESAGRHRQGPVHQTILLAEIRYVTCSGCARPRRARGCRGTDAGRVASAPAPRPQETRRSARGRRVRDAVPPPRGTSAPCSAAPADDRLQVRAVRRQTGHDRRQEHADLDARRCESGDRPQSLARRRRPGLEPPPEIRVERRETHAHRYARRDRAELPARRDPGSPSGPSSPRSPASSRRREPRGSRASGGSGPRSADRDRSPCRRPPSPAASSAVKLRPHHRHRVDLHEDHAREVLAGAQIEVRVIPAREAVVAPVHAPAIGVHAPAEPHALTRSSARSSPGVST